MSDRHDASDPGDTAPPLRPGYVPADRRPPAGRRDDNAAAPADEHGYAEGAAPPAYDDGDSRVFLEGDG